ncbi:SigE family RNA polymerase sigma factor (plasmid) [Embleya sp. NBC_00888]|uniref:RNA polymerase sigma factor n=1 Tax=Embleya sp. NBC_00888 TaxID=2975960 RepID=UPI002F912DA5|nr:SigE family RNA polymerase sigma factor [Embleya sp. NBC_00888]
MTIQESHVRALHGPHPAPATPPGETDPPRRRGFALFRRRTREVGEPPPTMARLYHAHRLRLVRLATLLVGDQETAEDVVQDAFTAAFRRYGARLGELDDPPAYLRRCVVNGARSVPRRRRTARACVPPVVPSVASPEDDALRAERDLRLRNALAGLTRRQCEVLVLRYWENLSESEIAGTLGIPSGAVKSTASRGLTALHKLLEDDR